MPAGRILVASDWHLGPRSPASHARLALAFLERARAESCRVVLNGDIFEELFERPGCGRQAHPGVARLIEQMAGERLLERIEGNHDPGAGAPRLELSVVGLGRVLVEHGHAHDPVHGSLLGRAGQQIASRLQGVSAVRAIMALADAAARMVAKDKIERVFRMRCLATVERGGFAIGVFGHIHRGEALPGERYANSGALSGEVLEYLELLPEGPRLGRLSQAELP